MAVDLLLGTLELLSADRPFDLPERFAPLFAAGGIATIWLDGCLALWPSPSWARIAERLLELPLASSDARTFRRLVFGSAVEMAWGRPVTLPVGLLGAAGIEDRGVLVGAGDHAELWSPPRWADVSNRAIPDLALPIPG